MLVLLQEKDMYTGNLILVNAQHKYREYGTQKRKLKLLAPGSAKEEDKEAYGQDSGTAADVRLDRWAADSLLRLVRSIHARSRIVPVSGWRSMDEQQQIWNDSLAEHGRVFTQTYVAAPGHSEHQTGLAIDLGKKKEHIDFICPDFPYDGICQQFREKAAEYGFIERYPRGRENVTGIGHEPWHFRFVGMPHAQIMREQGLTLEEYMDFLRQYPYGSRPYRVFYGGQEIDVAFLEASDNGSARLEPDMQMPYTVSGNNIDGFIVTEWRRMYA